MSEQKQIWKERIALYGGVLLILLICLGLIWLYRYKTIPSVGASLRADRAIDLVAVEPVLQVDPSWADEPMGPTGYTIGQQGSLLACISMAAQTKGESATIAQLNQDKMYTDNRYTVDDLEKVLPGASIKVKTVFEKKDLATLLKNGGLPLCMLRDEDGAEHWVAVVGADDENSFLCIDPREDGTPRKLTENVFLLVELIMDKT